MNASLLPDYVRLLLPGTLFQYFSKGLQTIPIPTPLAPTHMHTCLTCRGTLQTLQAHRSLKELCCANLLNQSNP